MAGVVPVVVAAVAAGGDGRKMQPLMQQMIRALVSPFALGGLLRVASSHPIGRTSGHTSHRRTASPPYESGHESSGDPID